MTDSNELPAPANGLETPGAKPAGLAKHLPFLVLVGFTLGVAFFFYQVVKPLLMPLFLAAVAVLLAAPWHAKLHGKMPAWASATIVTVTIFLAIVAPISLGVFIAVKDLADLLQHVRSLATPEALQNLIDPNRFPWLVNLVKQISTYAPIDTARLSSMAIDVVSGAGETLYRTTSRMIGNLPWAALNIFVFAVATWFFLVDGDDLLDGWRSITPLRAADDTLIRTEFASVCRGVVWGTLLAGIAQSLLLMAVLGLIAAASAEIGLGSWIVLLGLLTLIFAMIPFVGATAVWGPTAIWLILQGHMGAGITLIVFGALIISTADNLIKIWAIQDAAKLHPLFVFICVFGGLKLLGILGVFVGPIVGAVLFAVVKVLRKESSLLGVGRAT